MSNILKLKLIPMKNVNNAHSKSKKHWKLNFTLHLSKYLVAGMDIPFGAPMKK